jgi:hypothetical protein
MITKIMGALLFLAGLIMLLISMLALLGLSQPTGLLERLIVFGGGVLLCVMGYLMAREKLGTPE